ncbi:MAG: DoxX family protein [Hyphomicrobiales bacterium]|nr:DoxX family protein [Hyphomicrobiales bacterium]MDE2115347.1 DoxX family protein [Hyphomicrobiales bacterium]
MFNATTNNLAILVGRILLVLQFVPAGFGKIEGYSHTAGYMASKGVPTILLPLVILVELVGGLCIIFGFQTRIAAFLLGGFTLLAAWIFHNPMDQTQMMAFMSHLSIIGGFGVLVGAGAGTYSVDGMMGNAGRSNAQTA